MHHKNIIEGTLGMGQTKTEDWIKKLWKWEDDNELITENNQGLSDVIYHRLPRNRHEMKKLRELYICEDLDPDFVPITLKTAIPKEISNFINLELLVISVTNILDIPKEIGALTNLQDLVIENCYRIREIPEEIGNLNRLKRLRLVGNHKLSKLPNSISHLSQVTSLDIFDNTELILTQDQRIWLQGLVESGFVRGHEYLLGTKKTIIPIDIQGNWKAGWALDLHTIKSTRLDDGTFDTAYTDIGFSLNQLKYHQDYSQINHLASAAIEFLRTRLVTPYLDVIIPVPPSNLNRERQPVYEIAKIVSQTLSIPFDTDYVLKRKGTQELKDIDDPGARSRVLEGAFTIDDLRYRNKKVLLFDDLYRSGATLSEITKMLYKLGKVQNVYIVTLTKTRTKR